MLDPGKKAAHKRLVDNRYRAPPTPYAQGSERRKLRSRSIEQTHCNRYVFGITNSSPVETNFLQLFAIVRPAGWTRTHTLMIQGKCGNILIDELSQWYESPCWEHLPHHFISICEAQVCESVCVSVTVNAINYDLIWCVALQHFKFYFNLIQFGAVRFLSFLVFPGSACGLIIFFLSFWRSFS